MINKKIIVIFLLSLLLCGCSSKENIDIKANEEENVNTKANEKQDRLKEFFKYREIPVIGYEWTCEIELTDIKDIGTYDARELFIDKNGFLYEFSLSQKFSTTNTNCKKVDTNKKFERFIHGFIISTDKKIYYYSDGKFEERPYNVMSFSYELYDYDKNLIGDYGGYMGTIKNNKLYIYEINNNKITKSLLYEFDDDEYFIESHGLIIKTNKAYYSYGVINEKDCDQYADIECEEGIIKDEKLTNIYDDIIYTNNRYFILKDSDKLYSDALGG